MHDTPAYRPHPPDHTESSVRQRPSPLINLYDWVTRTCFGTALGPRGAWSVNPAYYPYHDRSHMHPGFCTYLPPPESGCFRFDTEIFIFQTAAKRARDSSSPSKVCLFTDHACCFLTAGRGGARLSWRRRPSGSRDCHFLFSEPISWVSPRVGI